jgi:hypothetical protein
LNSSSLLFMIETVNSNRVKSEGAAKFEIRIA